jgi:hypothetical protein
LLEVAVLEQRVRDSLNHAAVDLVDHLAGLIGRPQSCTAKTFFTWMRPVSLSTTTSATSTPP